MRSFACGLVTANLVAGALVLANTPANAAEPPPIEAVDVTTLGSGASTAAGSCWEIKQLRPSATDGVYWLQTPRMTEAGQYHCDMTTDGGGWVLIGKGRENWSIDYLGQGAASSLHTPETVPMSGVTAQMSSPRIDGLLDGGRVDALTEGVRLRRARDTAGSAWQEARVRFNKKDRWTWTFGAEHTLAGFSFDGAATNGGTSPSFGNDQQYRRVTNTTGANMGWRRGFAYGTQVTGSTSATTHLWVNSSGAGNPLPYTQVYIRPRISSVSGFAPIGDGGTAAFAQPKSLRSNALVSPYVVTGLAGSTASEWQVEVQAFTRSGDNMYVGGNFRYVQNAATSEQLAQPFLAAFNAATGEWVSSFRPALNEQVHALATLPDGSVVAGGIFTSANGRPVTGIVALDPTTGSTNPGWNVTIEQRVTGGTLKVRALHAASESLYISGSFTHLSGGSSPNTSVYMKGLARVSLGNGTPGTGWNPEFSASVEAIDVSADNSRVYAAGHFTRSKTTEAKNAAAVLTASGADLASPAWTPTWSASKSYQQAIGEAGGHVYVGGSEHSFFGFSTSTFQRLSGSITKRGGDFQAIGHNAGDGLVFGGCHCDEWTYQDAYTWSNIGTSWTQADGISGFGQWDAATGRQIPHFRPNFKMRIGSGIWALEWDDLTRTTWAGGDISTVRTGQGQRFSGGFARFPMMDSTPPTTPTDLRVTGQTDTTVSLAWTGSTDAGGGGVRYQVLLDDRTVGSTAGNQASLTVPKHGQGRYFVRAIDGAGNLSTSTSVLQLPASDLPPTASFSWSANRAVASLDGTGSSTPAGSITSYAWDFGDGATGAGGTTTHAYAAAGDYLVTLSVTDSAGKTDTVTRLVSVTAPASPSPTDVYGQAVYDQEPWLYYRVGETSGTTAVDAGPDRRNGTYAGTWARGVPGALKNSTDPAIRQSSLSSGFVVSPTLTAAPTEFTIGAWFRTTSLSGGRLIGYSSSSTGLSGSYDRQLQVQSTGQIRFGVAPGGSQVSITSPSSYRDGGWHYAVGTQSSSGMRLYVDGQLVASGTTTTGQNFVGYWKVGNDKVFSGALVTNLAGDFDEAVVYTRALTADQIQDQWVKGSTVITPPDNTPPTASFTASMNDLSGSFDAASSSDAEGPIASYAWDFGDGDSGTGVTATHQFPSAGTYTVSLTVTDAAGATDTVSQQVTAVAPRVDTVVIDNGMNWRWRYTAGAPDLDWNQRAFDASSWNQGHAHLGFGAPIVVTNIDTFATTPERPLAAYFSRTFDVQDTSRVVRLVLDTVGDDGVVVYINGTEVGRQNMPEGPVTHQTWALSARRYTVAAADPLVVDVPVGLLVNGTNVVAAETHLNYRATRDLTFDLKATLTTQ